ncbi:MULTISPECIES: hypothetical protein [unclassified Sinorhizobium]|uniref:hypothetical protein n=1 Tax=unclassified Sinorhizobium TaxID=2613772 RepID=UPI0024C3D62D|nr:MULTISPECIES: hypothetical protein [unclassified Sinorhizobium]MDK1377643.1 hypothetical protein [Sinorhizobium sp. 6-70]MDK1481637.1 hypothetical protein [Sinorhizobium sp. 6-117]
MTREFDMLADETTHDENLVTVISQIRRLIDAASLECGCRTRVDELLLRFESLTARQREKRMLDQARRQRRRIATIMELLHELDEIGYGDADRSVLVEARLLFEDIAEAALQGARLLNVAALPSSKAAVR